MPINPGALPYEVRRGYDNESGEVIARFRDLGEARLFAESAVYVKSVSAVLTEGVGGRRPAGSQFGLTITAEGIWQGAYWR